MTSMPDTRTRRGASIAVFKGNSILLIKRAKAPWLGLWSLPGGSLERGESAYEAAYRELKEETGIDASVEGLLDTIEVTAGSNEGEAARYSLEVFYGRYGEGSLRAGSDAAEAQWFDVAALEKLNLTEGTASLIGLAAARLGVPSPSFRRQTTVLKGHET